MLICVQSTPQQYQHRMYVRWFYCEQWEAKAKKNDEEENVHLFTNFLLFNKNTTITGTMRKKFDNIHGIFSSIQNLLRGLMGK